MLVGISGYIGSGKDSVARIIQYFMEKKRNPNTFFNQYVEDYAKYEIATVKNLLDNNRIISTDWEIKKFAGKLKQIVSLLTGIPVEDLEKQEVKDSELGKEWSCFQFSNGIVAYTEDQFEFDSRRFPGAVATYKQMTVRDLLQRLGTDAMRDKVHPNIHVNALFADYKPLPAIEFCDGYYMGICINCKQKFTADKRQGWCKECVDNQVPKYPNWLISDMRFPNELEAVKQRGGITVRVNRRNKIQVYVDTDSMTSSGKQGYETWVKSHPSETSLDSAEFDYVIENNAGIPELLEQVKQMLIHFKLI